MYALTLWQPWAEIIALGWKLVENRTWAPPYGVIGERIAIHAGKRWSRDAADAISTLTGEWFPRESVDLGAIIATAVVRGVARGVREVPDADQGRWWSGPVGWVLGDVRRITPVLCGGRQRLWRVPEEALARITSTCLESPVPCFCGQHEFPF